ncbi:MAG: hypothetical protein RI637_13080, partial [Acidimicrobiia bacterium]|nr:hypothetical protein [Acidimicrobiia bacterium]
GYGRHGKDTVAEILTNYGYTFVSSSWAAAEHAVFPVLGPKYGYESVEECFNDRANHRREWYELIKAYNTPDLARLARQIYSEADIYVGIRDRDEFYDAKNEGLFDYAIWVDASHRLPVESTDSCTVNQQDADIVIDNNGPEKHLPIRVWDALSQVNSLEKVKQKNEAWRNNNG